MAQLPDPLDRLDAEGRRVYERITARRGPIRGPYAPLMHHPALAEPVAVLGEFRGVEVEGTLPLPYNLTFWANYSYQQTAAGGDPLGLTVNRLTELPEPKANIGLRYRADNGAEAKLYLRLVSQRSQPQVTVVRNVITGVEYSYLKEFITTNLEARYPVANWKGCTGYLFAGVDNLFGIKYMESYGYPMPTQTWFGGIQLRY